MPKRDALVSTCLNKVISLPSTVISCASTNKDEDSWILVTPLIKTNRLSLIKLYTAISEFINQS